MKHARRYFWVILVILAAIAAVAMTGGLRAKSRLQYWQRQAARVHVGMTREDAEAILPRQSYDSWVWQLEEWRLRHTPRLPALKHVLEFRMIHYDTGNTMGYEVAKGAFVTVRYDLAGSAPGLALPGRGTVQPKDRVVTAPEVIPTPRDPSGYLSRYLYKHQK